jgi:ABC-type cobalamin/Fe3+-siderophores transport system ATPase subunit
MSAKKSAEILRYWSALLKYQEALSARPRARRLEASELRPPNLQQPVTGRDYTKLPLESAAAFFVDKGPFEPLALDAERTEFFENWLAQRYRRADDDEEVSELVLFPALHLPRDELAGVLRFPVELEWRSQAGQFLAPPPAERAQGRYPEPPTELRLSRPGRQPDEGLPFFLDASLLQRTLRVEPEELDALFARLRRMKDVTPTAMIEATCELLERPLDGEPSADLESKPTSRDGQVERGAVTPPQLMLRLFQAVQRRCQALGGRSRCYPVGLLVSTERVRATFHVQRDIAQAVAGLSDKTQTLATPLASYLAGRSPDLTRELCLGRWSGSRLTDNQREALELGLGSEFCAIQGPPGTGKTTLILNAVAHQLVEKAAAIARSGQPKQSFLMVTSTNNRAVDNVIEPLSSGAYADFPLALRLGSREVTGSVTLRALTRLLAYVDRARDVSDEDFEQAQRSFQSKLELVEQRLAPERRRISAARAKVERERELATLEERLSKTSRAPDAELPGAISELFGQTTLAPAEAAPYLRDRGGAQRETALLIQALARLSRDAESENDAALKRIEVGFRRVARERVPPLERWFGASLALALPPRAKPGARVLAADWEEALEDAIGKLLSLEAALGALASRAQESARLEALRAEASAKPTEVSSEGNEPVDEEEFAALTQAALELRDFWLRHNRRDIREAVNAAIGACTRNRSLRVLLDATTGAGLWLRRLFPCFGCTLLSLGNAFSGERPVFERVIVDEAGQCHPAYVVSALLRARVALVIGDVHQLEPVIGLGREDERRIAAGLKLGLSEAELQPYRTYDESGNSAQSLAERAVAGRPTLRDHFRCQAEIALLSDRWCGYGLIPRAPLASCRHVVPELIAPVLLASVQGEQERYLGSYRNPIEALEVTSWVQHLLRAGLSPGDIAVITPYRGQFEHLLQTLQNARIPVERPADDLVEDGSLDLFAGSRAALAVGTVHRFQGGERRVVILSTAVTRSASLGFIDDRVHLLNVATSRAKEHLIVVGHAATLSRGRHTRALVESATEVTLAKN